jgi:hypothetical protein
MRYDELVDLEEIIEQAALFADIHSARQRHYGSPGWEREQGMTSGYRVKADRCDGDQALQLRMTALQIVLGLSEIFLPPTTY